MTDNHVRCPRCRMLFSPPAHRAPRMELAVHMNVAHSTLRGELVVDSILADGIEMVRARRRSGDPEKRAVR